MAEIPSLTLDNLNLNKNSTIDDIEIFGVNVSEVQKNNLKKDSYILVSLHREENVDDKKKLNNILRQIEKIETKNKLKILFSTHQRTKKN